MHVQCCHYCVYECPTCFLCCPTADVHKWLPVAVSMPLCTQAGDQARAYRNDKLCRQSQGACLDEVARSGVQDLRDYDGLLHRGCHGVVPHRLLAVLVHRGLPPQRHCSNPAQISTSRMSHPPDCCSRVPDNHPSHRDPCTSLHDTLKPTKCKTCLV